MDLQSLAKIIDDEMSTMKYIESISRENIKCKFCTSDQFYSMKNKNMLRCKICRKDPKPPTNSNFSLLYIPYLK